MPKTPVVRPKALVSLLLRLGFFIDRQHGSHIILMHGDGRRTVVAMHKKDIALGTLMGILDDAEMTAEDLKKNL